MSKLVIHSLYNPPPSVDTLVEGESLTQQQFAAECDINTIMKRYADTGSFYEPDPSRSAPRAPLFGDFMSLDYQQALNAVMDADEAFSTLPATLRARFENDPSKLIEFLQDTGNREEAISLGLIEAKPDLQAPPSSEPKT